MSNRAEEAAMKAYPDEHFISNAYAEMCRSFYQEGYELGYEEGLENGQKEGRTNLLKAIQEGVNQRIAWYRERGSDPTILEDCIKNITDLISMNES